METAPRPLARHSLALALAASGFGPAGLALGFLLGGVWSGLAAAGLVVALVAIGTTPITVPLALAALGSYRRQAGPSRQRTVWTAVVLVLLAPTVFVLISFVYAWATTG